MITRAGADRLVAALVGTGPTRCHTHGVGLGSKFIQRTAPGRVPTPILDAAGRAFIEGIDRAVAARWDRAKTVAAEAPGKTPKAKAKAIAGPIRKNMTVAGAAAGATAAAPGVGTSVAMTALVAEIGLLALRTTDLVMAIGAAHGFVDAEPEERRAWVLAVMAFGEDAAEEFTTLARDMGLRVVDGHAIDIAGETILGGGGQVATIDALRRINSALVTHILKRWGARRGAATVGKLLPFGIGAAVGGSANWWMLREFGKQAERFFASYDRDFLLGLAHPTDEERRQAIDVAGQQI